MYLKTKNELIVVAQNIQHVAATRNNLSLWYLSLCMERVASSALEEMDLAGFAILIHAAAYLEGINLDEES